MELCKIDLIIGMSSRGRNPRAAIRPRGDTAGCLRGPASRTKRSQQPTACSYHSEPTTQTRAERAFYLVVERALRARFYLEETNLESFHISPEKAFTLQPAGNEPRVEADVSPDPARKKPNATLTATAFRQEPECDPFYEGSVQTPVDDPARRWQLFERDRHSFGKATR